MHGTWSHIVRCLDLREEDIARAVASRDGAGQLLARLAEVSAPETGAAKVLLVFARMATTACDWLEGALRVELNQQGEATVAGLTTDLGGGLLERALPVLILRAPLAEFTRAIERVPRLIAPLKLRGRTDQRIVLTASALIRRTSAPPPPIEVASDSLLVHAPAPPASREVGLAPQGLPAVGPIVAPSGPPAPSVPPDSLDAGWDD